MRCEVGGIAFRKEEVWDRIAQDEFQMWVTADSVTVTRVISSSFKHFCQILFVGGRLKDVLSITRPAVERWALDHDCESLIGGGRKSWAAALSKVGFYTHSITVVKPLRE